MAIYGVGAFYEQDVSGSFIKQNLVGAGWHLTDAPDLHQFFRSFKVGDIVYIKAAFGGNDITVKAIGIIKDAEIKDHSNTNNLVAVGRNVLWLNKTKFVIPKPKDKNNVRSNTVYEEFNPIVQQEIIARIGSCVQP